MLPYHAMDLVKLDQFMLINHAIKDLFTNEMIGMPSLSPGVVRGSDREIT